MSQLQCQGRWKEIDCHSKESVSQEKREITQTWISTE